MLGVFAEHDDYSTPDAIAALDQELTVLEKDHKFISYPGTHHAFFNDSRPEVYDAEASKDAWTKSLEFFRANLT